MKVVVLTSSEYGTASHHLPYLLKSHVCEISMVILNQDVTPNNKKYFRRKILKVIKIGILGSFNGIRMRKWFGNFKNRRSIEDICRENNIPFYKTPTINCEITKELFQQANCDLGLSLGNGYINQKIFSIPTYGMVNIHHEILPAYQNAQSIIWQIYNMSAVTGYTIHKIDKKIDTGEILYQQEVPISFSQTLSQTVTNTFELLLDASANGLVHVIQHFSVLQKQAKPQGKGRSYTTPSLWQFIRIYRNFKKLRTAATNNILPK